MRALMIFACIVGASVSAIFIFVPGIVFFSLISIALPLDVCANYLKSIKSLK